jgi:hypothetical protein
MFREILRIGFVVLAIAIPAGARAHAAVTSIVVNGGDCSDIQAAIAALPHTGGRVLVQPGTYVCTQPVIVDRGKIRLVGMPGTVLRLANGANAPVLIVGDTAPQPSVVVKNVRISDLEIDGNRANQSSETWPLVPDIRTNGVTLRGVKNVVVERVVVRSARSGGVVVERESRNVTVRQVAAYDNEFDGVAAYRTEKSKFLDLYLSDNRAAGLSFDVDFNRNLIDRVLIVGSAKVGIFMRDSTRNTFKHVFVVGSGEHAVFLADLEPPAVGPATRNAFRWLFAIDSAGAAFRVNDASCTGNTIVHAHFADNAGGCVSEVVPRLVPTSDVFCH